MRRLVIFMLGMLLLGMQVFAQNRTVTGKITDANGTPVPGATITVTGSNVRAVSAGNGDFSINVPSGSKSLTVSSVGYGTQTIELGVSNSVNFMLSQSIIENQAVVITGYKNVERSKYAGATSKVDEKAFRNVPVASFDQALQGRAS